jgi:hypothetical protein
MHAIKTRRQRRNNHSAGFGVCGFYQVSKKEAETPPGNTGSVLGNEKQAS